MSTSDGITVNLIKRMVNISTLLFYNVLSVQRLDILYYPSSVSTNCTSLITQATESTSPTST